MNFIQRIEFLHVPLFHVISQLRQLKCNNAYLSTLVFLNGVVLPFRMGTGRDWKQYFLRRVL